MDQVDAVLYDGHGPVAAASAFVHAFRCMNFERAWNLVDRDAQLADAQFWAHDSDRAWIDADTVVEMGAGSPLWRTYAHEHAARYLEILQPLLVLVDWSELGTVSGHRLVAPDVEDVWFTAGRESRTYETEEPVEVLRLLMRRRETWRVAGLFGDRPLPGHPPRIERYDNIAPQDG